MRLVSLLLSALLVIQLTQIPLAASAAEVKFTPGANPGTGSVEAEIPVTKIGKLVLTDGTAIIKGNTVDVIGVPANTTEKKNVLSGVLVKTDVIGNGKHGKINGLVYFRSGPSLTVIDDPNAEELIDLNDGAVVSGHITAINRDELEITDSNGRSRQISMVDVKTIHSPRIFAFGIAIATATAIAVGVALAASAPKMTFAGTFAGAKVAAVQPVEHVASTSGGMSVAAKVAIGVAVAAGVATAIAVPVALGVANANRGPTQTEQIQQANFLQLYREQLTKTGHFAEPPPPPPGSFGP